MKDTDIPKSAHTPRPQRPNLRVRLEKTGPYVDLGISHSELIVGILDTLDLICVHTGAGMKDSLRTAIKNLNVHRGAKP